jgi:hypothetical protein
MNKVPKPIPDGFLRPPAESAGNQPPGVDAALSPPEHLMPYGAAAKAIFIKANGPVAYKFARRAD